MNEDFHAHVYFGATTRETAKRVQEELIGAFAVDAQYTVSHAGGSTVVTANQRVNGGQWNLLGSFTFNSGGSGYKVTLADNTQAKVAADAIYYVRDTAPTDQFVRSRAREPIRCSRAGRRTPATRGRPPTR